jgi:hypothetical protein
MKTSINLFAVLFLVTILGISCSSSSDEEIIQFQAGQKWRFSGRLQDPEPILIILKIEPGEKTSNIIHISVTGIHINNPKAPGGFTSDIAHLPFDEATLRKNVTEFLSRDNSLPEFQESYDIWREASDQGKAKVFTIPVAEAVDILEKTINRQ